MVGNSWNSLKDPLILSIRDRLSKKLINYIWITTIKIYLKGYNYLDLTWTLLIFAIVATLYVKTLNFQGNEELTKVEVEI